jgi:hypothetical protein
MHKYAGTTTLIFSPENQMRSEASLVEKERAKEEAVKRAKEREEYIAKYNKFKI